MSKVLRQRILNNPVAEYWEWIKKNKKCVSLKVYKVYKELIRVMLDKKSVWEYDPQKADDAIYFIENYCKHSKAKCGGQPFILELWQKALVAATFGFVHKIDGFRKHSEVLLVVARKNGKSTLASAIGLYLMIADKEPGAEVYACATKKDQAKIIWLEAKRMVKKSPALRRRIKTLVGELNSDFNESFFKPLGADSETLDGLNVHGALLDEIHAWKGKDLYDVIVDGVTARDQPLIFITTTAGTVREGIYDIKYNDAELAIQGYENGDNTFERFLPIIYELDEAKEWTNPKCWMKANPGLGTIKKLDKLQEKVRKAQKNKLLQKNLLCKDFNVKGSDVSSWLTPDQAKNKAKFDLSEVYDTYAIGGVDLSSTTDLTCATMLVLNNSQLYCHQKYFLPEDLIELRATEDHIPYDIWESMGWIEGTQGAKIDYQRVTDWFCMLRDEYKISFLWIYYDPWNSGEFVQQMINEGFTMVECRQGTKTMSQPMKILSADLTDKKINYNNNPILYWCLTNTNIKQDDNENIRPVKKSSIRRIDGAVSLINAYVGYVEHMTDYHNLVA